MEPKQTRPLAVPAHGTYVPAGSALAPPVDPEPQLPRASGVLDEAHDLITGPRQGAYGHPRDNFARIAAMWSAILGVPVTPRHVAKCMAALKLARDTHTPGRDNLVDGAAYLALAEEVSPEP